MFRAHVLVVRRPKLYYTASGIITHIGVMMRGEIIAGYSEIITKDTNTLSGQNPDFFIYFKFGDA